MIVDHPNKGAVRLNQAPQGWKVFPLVHVNNVRPERIQSLLQAVQRMETGLEQFPPCRFVFAGSTLGEQPDLVPAFLHFRGGNEGVGLRPAKTPETLMREEQFHGAGRL